MNKWKAELDRRMDNNLIPIMIHEWNKRWVYKIQAKWVPVGQCDMGLECNERGACYARASGQPEKCGADKQRVEVRREDGEPLSKEQTSFVEGFMLGYFGAQLQVAR